MKRITKKIIITLICLGIQQLVSGQIQKGSDIDGEMPSDYSGQTVSMPDSNTVAIGAPYNDGNGSNAGQVRVYKWSGSAWIQKGSDIDGEAAGDVSGASLSMPDSNTVAIGAPSNDGNGSASGHVRVYKWNGSAWTQKGADIDGETAGDQSGYSVSMPDTNTVAIGSAINDDGGTDAGQVRVYKWNGSGWIQKGADIDGASAGDQSGWAVNMPDSNTVAIGAHWDDGNGANAGQVRIFSWNGSAWTQKGSDINGEAAGDYFGHSVFMPDSNTFAAGAINNDGNGSNAGHVRVYAWTGSDWSQKGVDIDGEAAGDYSGFSVSMPDSNTVAIGANGNDGNGSNAGHVRVYNWNGSAWVQKFSDFDGEASNDNSGISISMPDIKTLAIGANNNSDNGTGSGHVRVFYLCNTFSTDIITACDSLTWIDGIKYTASNNTATYTMPNAAGCDSIITLNLTIKHSSSSTDVITACDSLTWIDGIKYTASNNTATYTLTNAAGCDSLVTLNLTINHSTTGTDIITACDSLTWIDGITYTASNNTATYTLTNAAGCDSLVTLNLTINHSTTGTDVITACDSLTWIDGITYTASNNTATYNLTNAAGCDSLVTLNLTINHSTTGTDIITACDSLTWIDGITYTASNNTATYTLTNAAGCDSLVTLNLTINHSTTGNDIITACDSLTWIDGITYTASNNTATYTLTNAAGCDSVVTLNLIINNSTTSTISLNECFTYTAPDATVYTESGTYTSIIPNSAGCDSIITINLTIDTVDITVTETDSTLIANATPATYQWVGCPSMVLFGGDTLQTLVPYGNGSYACIVTQNGCVDTTSCYYVQIETIMENTFNSNILLYPNPTQGKVIIDLGSENKDVEIMVLDFSGKEISKKKVTNLSRIEMEIPGTSGVYFVSIESEKGRALLRLLKE